MPQTLIRNLMDKVEYNNIYNLLEDASTFFFFLRTVSTPSKERSRTLRFSVM